MHWSAQVVPRFKNRIGSKDVQGGQFMVVKLSKTFFCFKLLPLWVRFCLKIIDFNENHKITNKNIKGLKALKKKEIYIYIYIYIKENEKMKITK